MGVILEISVVKFEILGGSQGGSVLVGMRWHWVGKLDGDEVACGGGIR